ncbi:MAG: hypothetical protein JWN83_1255 [Chitinophagaceae bacterium]|nr:hypothetical protein [Chitinophagaceae bacterium]
MKSTLTCRQLQNRKHVNIFRYFSGIVFLFAGLFFTITSAAQTGCKTGCTSNDVQIKRAYLVDAGGNALSTNCTYGDAITAYLALDLTASTPRVGVSISGNVKIHGTETIVSGGALARCFSNSLISTSTNPTTRVIYPDPITWTCGTSIDLKNVFIAWGTGNTNFCTGTAAQCPATSSKCWSQPIAGYIPVVSYPCVPAGITSTTPADDAECEGGTASFTVAYSGGSGTPTIQWQVKAPAATSFTNISGETSATLTLNNVAASKNGYQYHAVLTSTSESNQSCTATSRDATLTVYSNPGTITVTTVNPTCSSSTGTVTVSSPVDDVNNDYEYQYNSDPYGDSPGPFTFTAGAGYSITVRRKNTTCTSSTSCAGETLRTSSILSQQQSSKGVSSTVKPISPATAIAPVNIDLSSSQTNVKAYPNPFNDKVKFVVTSEKAGIGMLEIFNTLGQKIITVYQGLIPAGINNFELSLPGQNYANLIYRFRMGEKKITGKLLQVNQ